MIRATFQMYNENDKDGEPFTKDFLNDDALLHWRRSQQGHPFLSFSLIDYFEIIELTWDNWVPVE